MKYLLILFLLLASCSKHDVQPTINGSWQFSNYSPSISGEFIIQNDKVVSGTFKISGDESVITTVTSVGTDISLEGLGVYIHLKGIVPAEGYSTLNATGLEYHGRFKEGLISQLIVITRQ